MNRVAVAGSLALVAAVLFSGCYNPYAATQPVLQLSYVGVSSIADVWIDGDGAYSVEGVRDFSVTEGSHSLVWNIATKGASGVWSYSQYYRKTVNVPNDRITAVSLGGA